MKTKYEHIEEATTGLFDEHEMDITGLSEGIESYATQQAIAFAQWKHDNRWFSFENGYWYYTFEQGTSMSEAAYNKKYRKTTDDLYAQFIEQQLPK